MFFILFSILVIVYLVYSFNTMSRMPIIFEVFFLAIFGVVFLIFLYPNILNIIEDVLGIQSAINFILYLSIFVSYFLIFILYRKDERQRIEITKLTREIAFLKKKDGKRK